MLNYGCGTVCGDDWCVGGSGVYVRVVVVKSSVCTGVVIKAKFVGWTVPAICDTPAVAVARLTFEEALFCVPETTCAE